MEKMTKIYHDLTLELSPDSIVYPADLSPKFQELKRISKGDPFNLTSLTFTTHTGTHIDVPKHFNDDGLTIDKLSFDYLIGPARVIELKGRNSITEIDLQKETIEPNEIILLKTDNSELLKKKNFDTNFTHITPEAARYLVRCDIKTIGIDYFSVEKIESPEPEVHKLFLDNSIPIIEGIDLINIAPGTYHLIALPLKIKDGNGCPSRVVLVEET